MSYAKQNAKAVIDALDVAQVVLSCIVMAALPIVMGFVGERAIGGGLGASVGVLIAFVIELTVVWRYKDKLITVLDVTERLER